MSDPDDLRGQTVAKRYRIVRAIGEGGMGIVWEAEQLDLPRRVALKALPRYVAFDGNAVRRFKREAESAASLQHPNIAQIFDFYLGGDGPPALVMELLDGAPLEDEIARGPIAPERIALIARQVLSALAVAHDHAIVHRDIKPANIFLSRGPTGEVVKILDFGVAKVLDSAPITATGIVLGTPLYMAPEQASGQPVTPATDLYALGVCIYEMVAGRAPWGELSGARLVSAIVLSEPTPLRELAPHAHPLLVEVVERALQKNPADRFASARAMSDALAPLDPSAAPVPARSDRALAPTLDAAANALDSAPAPRVVVRPAVDAPRPRRSQWPAFVISLLVVLLVGAIVAATLALRAASRRAAAAASGSASAASIPAPASVSVPVTSASAPDAIADAAVTGLVDASDDVAASTGAHAVRAPGVRLEYTAPNALDIAQGVHRTMTDMKGRLESCFVGAPACAKSLRYEVTVDQRHVLVLRSSRRVGDVCPSANVQSCMGAYLDASPSLPHLIEAYSFEIIPYPLTSR
ncbi:MAG: serine/threonine-protein kinase [Polyangiaceae bacterium]